MNHQEKEIRNRKIIALYKKEKLSIKALNAVFHLSPSKLRKILGKGFWREEYKRLREKRINDAFIKAETLARQLKRLPTHREMYGIIKEPNDRMMLRAHLLKLGFKGPHKYSKEYLLNHLKDLAKTLGRTPGQPDIKRDGTVSVTTYSNYFGGTSKAQKAAGLVPNKAGQAFGKTRRHDDELMLENLRAIAKKLGRPLYGADINANGKIERSSYVRHFGSLENARKKAGLPHPEHIMHFLKQQRMAAQK